MIKKIIFTLLVSFFLIFVFSFSVFAQTPIYKFLSSDGKTRLNYDIDSGEKLTVEFTIENIDKVTEYFQLNAQKGPINPEIMIHMPLDWVKYSSSVVEIPPGGKKNIKVIFDIPQSALSGLYATTILAKLVDYEGKDSTSGMVNFGASVGIITELNVTHVTTSNVDQNPAETPEPNYDYRFYLLLVVSLLLFLLLMQSIKRRR